MLYYIDGKFYILASNKYREVVVKKIKDTFKVEIVKNGKIIERIHNEVKPQMSVEEAYKKTNKSKLD